MPGSNSRKRQSRTNPLRSSARYNENTHLAAALEESRKMKELQNSEEFAKNLQAIEEQEERNRVKTEHRNYKMAKALQKGTPLKANEQMARNLQVKYNIEFAKSIARKNKKKTLISAEESKESDPPSPMYVRNPISFRLKRTRSRTVARSKPRSKSKSKSNRWWPF